MSVERFITQSRRLLGDRWVLTGSWEIYPYSRDYWPLLVYRELKGSDHSAPVAVVLPGSEEEVVEILRFANENHIVVVPYSGGSGVLGGAVPDSGWVVIDLSRLNWIKWYDEKAGIVDVGAGVYLRLLEEWLQRRGRTLRHFPQSYPEAMLGGLVSTRSIGQYSTGYGGIENMVLGLNIIVPRIGKLEIKPAPRRSLLLPLDHLFIGNEGLYGIVTRVYLSTYELPECSEKVGWQDKSFGDALEKARIIVGKRLSPDLFRIYDRRESLLHFGEEGSVSIGVVEGSCRLVRARIEELEKLVGKDVHSGGYYAEKWLDKRFNVIEDLWKIYELGMGFETIEVSVPWGWVYFLYSDSIQKLESIDGLYFIGVHASHFYQSGVALYYTVAYSLERLDDVYMRIWDTLMNETSRHNGSISHHHGVGRMRVKYLKLEYGERGIRFLNEIKKAVDPSNILRNDLLRHE
ncbi:MAG: FAD-binding oxidoreductase [Desulfurococcales archaeon]|nr:FAD-binding oxidoreductase [Desulfurococcales archaeon]